MRLKKVHDGSKWVMEREIVGGYSFVDEVCIGSNGYIFDEWVDIYAIEVGIYFFGAF